VEEQDSEPLLQCKQRPVCICDVSYRLPVIIDSQISPLLVKGKMDSAVPVNVRHRRRRNGGPTISIAPKYAVEQDADSTWLSG